jgi:hypothetical protein
MEIPEGVACEVCLRADEPEQMLRVAIPYALHNPTRAAVVCLRCAREISVQYNGVLDEDADANREDKGRS